MATLKPVPRRNLIEWADEFRRLSKRAAAQPGRWRSAAVPMALGPMLAVTDPRVRTITAMAPTQEFKALDCETPIATPDGWITMGEIETGQTVFDETGRPCRVVGVSPVYHRDRCIEVEFSDGSKIVCDDDHRWQVDDNAGGNVTSLTRIARASELLETWDATKPGERRRNRYAIPVAGALDLPDADLPIPPYALGVWLGDGHSYSTDLTLHENDAQILDELEAEGVRTQIIARSDAGVLTARMSMGRDAETCRRGHDMRATGRTGRGHCAECSRQSAMAHKHDRERKDAAKPELFSMGERLGDMGLMKGTCRRPGGGKRIPPQYLRASYAQRLALLQGLMDTDGAISAHNARSNLTTKDREFADQVLELLCSLGLKGRVIEYTAKCKYKGQLICKPAYRLDFTAYAETPVFRLRRKLDRQAPRAGRRATETERRRVTGVRVVSPRPVRCISVDSPSRLYLCGRAMIPTHNTELLLNAAGYFVHQDPAPILMVLPTDKLGESFSKDRLQPMLSETPALSVVSPDDKSRTSDSTLTRKAFSTGAVIDIVGANSPTDLSSRPKRVVLADEIDKFPPSAGKEGDPLTLAEKRQSTFWNAKSIRACSPTQKGFSRVGREYAMSDQRKLHVRCPHCGDAQPLDFKRVRWDKDENGQHRPETAGVTCRSCGSVWTETERRAAVMAVVTESDFGWRQTKPFRCCGEDHKPLTWTGDEHWNERGEALCPTCSKPGVPVRHAGFNASRLYSLTVPLSAVVEEFLAAKDDPTLLQPFVNTTLAEEWEESSVKVDPGTLLARREVYGPDDVPAGALVLTAGIDTQDNRLEVEVVGWGKGWESWGIQYAVIYGDPALPQVWRELDALLLRAFTRADGRPMRIQAACIDSGGHHAEQVFQFTQPRFGRRVYAIKGTGQPGAPIWPRRASRSKDRKTLFIVGSSSATDQVYGWLRVDSPGAGYCHFSADYDEAYFNGLLAEKAVVRKIGGQMVRAYECPPGARNEPLDCRKYALAALKSMNVAMPDVPVEDAPQAAPAPTQPGEAPAPTAPQAAPAPPPRSKRKRRSALNQTGGSWL